MNGIPLPVQFNCWKHHSVYIREKIKSTDINSFDHLVSEIKVIGKGFMDLYYGSISPETICGSILSQLGPYVNRAEYMKWINANPQNFRLILIADGSQWVLRLGDTDERYIHIHPARYSPFTVRVKAHSLKTAITVSVYSRVYNEQINMDLINRIRKNYLDLSPLKDLPSVPAIKRLIDFFTT